MESITDIVDRIKRYQDLADERRKEAKSIEDDISAFRKARLTIPDELPMAVENLEGIANRLDAAREVLMKQVLGDQEDGRNPND